MKKTHRSSSSSENVPQPFQSNLPAHGANRMSHRNSFWTDFNAVLCIPAICDPPDSHQRLQTLVLVHGAGRMLSHQVNLTDHRRAHEIRMRIHLRTGVEATPAGHAALK